MRAIKKFIRRSLPFSWLARADLVHWRRHKEDHIAALPPGQVHNLGIDHDSYNRRDEFYRYISETMCPDAAITYLEFGVHEGYSILTWAGLNRHPESRFIGFDTFHGLPEDWKSYRAGHFSTEGRTPQTDDARVRFVAGLFQDTLDGALAEIPRAGRLVVHIDSDLYSAALYVLTRLHDRLVPGTLIIFDQWVDIHEYRALSDYRSAYGTPFMLRATMNDAYAKVVLEVASSS